MRVLIIENEVYLAQSVSSKLLELGYGCDISISSKDIDDGVDYDIILLSTNILDKKFYPIIERYKKSVIILLVSYMSNDTVTKPLKAGANDYIMKPFIMEELIRKINHYMEFNRLKRESKSLKSYVQNYLNEIDIDIENKDEYKMPFVIKSNSQKIADYIAFSIADSMGRLVEFISLDSQNIKDQIQNSSHSILYFVNYHLLKSSDKKTFLANLKSSDCDKYIISTLDNLNQIDIRSIEINSKDRVFDRGNILTIDDYVKFIVLNYQYKYPDTELSKKLGISRKSLWEKRKKYGILKKK